MEEMSNKEKAEVTYKALQKRKKTGINSAKRKYKMGLSLAIESCKRHRGRDSRKYFF